MESWRGGSSENEAMGLSPSLFYLMTEREKLLLTLASATNGPDMYTPAGQNKIIKMQEDISRLTTQIAELSQELRGDLEYSHIGRMGYFSTD